MQNNIVYSSEEEALRNAGLTTGVAGHLPGQGLHHQHHVGAGVQGVPLVGGNYVSAPGTVITDTQYITGTTPFVGTGVTGVPLGTNITHGTHLTGTHLTGTELLGAGALGTGIAGAGYAGTHTHGVVGNTTGLVGTQPYGVVGNTTGLVGTQPYGVVGNTTGLVGTHTHGVVGNTTGLVGTHPHGVVGNTTGLVPNTALAGTGLGTFIFRPLEGKFLKDKDVVGKMDCYCKFKIGFHSGKSSVAKSEGPHPTWNDVISLNRKHNEEFAKLKIKDKDRLTLNDKVGDVKIPLNEIAAKGRVQQWFNVYKKDQLAGEILLDIEFQPRTVF